MPVYDIAQKGQKRPPRLGVRVQGVHMAGTRITAQGKFKAARENSISDLVHP
jgi:hypothetical protein